MHNPYRHQPQSRISLELAFHKIMRSVRPVLAYLPMDTQAHELGSARLRRVALPHLAAAMRLFDGSLGASCTICQKTP